MRNKSVIAIVCVLVFAVAAHSQKLTLLPQVGFENSTTSISYNNLSAFAPLGGEFSPQAGLRLDYRFKQGFGPYLAVSTSRSVVAYSFSNPETGMNVFDAGNGNMQLRLEGGYQYTTKPIYFNQSKARSAKSPATTITNRLHKSYSYKSGCSDSYSRSSSHCERKSESAKKSVAKNKGGWIKLQPSFGIGYIPSVQTDMVTKTAGGQTTYEYRAGNWNTALMTGMGFEFGRNQQRLFTVSINYFNGIGNMGEQTLTTTNGNKTTVTHLQSDASGWNVKMGIPFTIGQKKPEKKNVIETKTKYEFYRCIKNKTEYRYRCNRS